MNAMMGRHQRDPRGAHNGPLDRLPIVGPFTGFDQRLDGERNVARPNLRMQRLALGTFADLHHLDATLQELITGVVEADQICLVCDAHRMQSAASRARAHAFAHIPDFLDRPRALVMLANGEQVFALPDRFDDIDFSQESQPQGLLYGLEDRLLHGEMAVLVSSQSVPQFTTVTRVLLRHSSHHVRTREVVNRSR